MTPTTQCYQIAKLVASALVEWPSVVGFQTASLPAGGTPMPVTLQHLVPDARPLAVVRLAV